MRAAFLRCSIAIAIATLTLATASRSSAQELSEDIPVVGGTAGHGTRARHRRRARPAAVPR